jgi:hypothetical protein
MLVVVIVLSFDMGWRIIVFYPEPEARDKSTNIRQPMLKLKTHSGFHVMEYKQVPCVWRMPHFLYFHDEN